MSTLPLVGSTDTLTDAMQAIDRTGAGIALVVDRSRRLLDTLTDGDLRRAIIAGTGLSELVRSLKADGSAPVTATEGTDRAALLSIMRQHSIRQIPLTDLDGRVVGLARMDDLLSPEPLDVEAVVMAGGLGTRLRPLTESMPKPLLPVGGRPMLLSTLERLRDAGIRRATICTGYLADQVIERFGDGSGMGMELRYVREHRPLGTAGALALINPTGTLLVSNGDLVTTLDYRAMLEHHRHCTAELTVAVRRWEQQVPFGVVECDGVRVEFLLEKPTAAYLVNAGVYLVDPSAVALIVRGERLDMTDLIGRLLEKQRPVSAFAVIESWRDVGTPDEYRRANEEAI